MATPRSWLIASVRSTVASLVTSSSGVLITPSRRAGRSPNSGDEEAGRLRFAAEPAQPPHRRRSALGSMASVHQGPDSPSLTTSRSLRACLERRRLMSFRPGRRQFGIATVSPGVCGIVPRAVLAMAVCCGAVLFAGGPAGAQTAGETPPEVPVFNPDVNIDQTMLLENKYPLRKVLESGR